MAGNIDDDDYVASLLKKDAQTAKKKYELVGIDAFNPKRLKSGAPKPNTSFLRHIIRQTDSHNSALLAREAEESHARLKRMNQERIRAQKKEEILKERKADGRLTPVLSDEDTHSRPTRPRKDDEERSRKHGSGHRHRGERSPGSYDRRYRSRSRDEGRSKRRRNDSSERSSRRPKHIDSRYDKERQHRDDSDSEANRSHRKHKSSHGRKRDRSRSGSSSRSRSDPRHTDRPEKKRRHQSSSPSPRRDRQRHEERGSSSKTKRRSPLPHADSDSDPLEAIVGPLPPNIEPSVRSRGRGARKANSMGMDSRFNSTYDPKIDVRPPSDAEDDWGEAVELFRDRQRFKQQGAERLRAAGFTDEQVRKWEKGDIKDEEDVTWTERGQAREWDRGKVVDEDGDVELKAEWGRLK